MSIFFKVVSRHFTFSFFHHILTFFIILPFHFLLTFLYFSLFYLSIFSSYSDIFHYFSIPISPHILLLFLHFSFLSTINASVNRILASQLIKPILKATISICMFKWNQIFLNTIIKAEVLYQLMYLRFICTKLKLIDVITIPTSLSI